MNDNVHLIIAKENSDQLIHYLSRLKHPPPYNQSTLLLLTQLLQ